MATFRCHISYSSTFTCYISFTVTCSCHVCFTTTFGCHISCTVTCYSHISYTITSICKVTYLYVPVILVYLQSKTLKAEGNFLSFTEYNYSSLYTVKSRLTYFSFLVAKPFGNEILRPYLVVSTSVQMNIRYFYILFVGWHR